MRLAEKTPSQGLDIPADLGPPWAYMDGSTTCPSLRWRWLSTPNAHTHLLMEVPLTDLWAAKAEALVISRFLGLQCDPTQDLGSQVPNVEA